MLSALKHTMKRETTFRAYYRAMELIHRLRSHDVDAWGINPYRLYEVDPRTIRRFSGRNRSEVDDFRDFGRILDGDWDRSGVKARQSESECIALRLANAFDDSLAQTFDDTLLHASLRQRFIEGAAWEETAFIREMITAAPHHNWPSYANPEAIRRKWESLDRVFTAMRDHGFKSTRAIVTANRNRRDFLEVMENEILVDLGRDGELLFFDGKHRLSMAKLLGLTKIHVAIVVRHPAALRDGIPIAA